MARKKTITKRRRGLFLDKLKATGQVTAAAIAGEISRQSFYDKRDTDAEFAREWDDAERTFLDKLEGVAIGRAVTGVNEDKPYTDIKDGTKTTRMRTVNTKSDRLLELTLKARHPDYKPVKRIEQTSPDGSMTPVAPPIGLPDLSNLSDDELQTLTELTRKAHGTNASA